MKWPASTDRLFRPGGAGPHLAMRIGFDFAILADGYKTSGDSLVQKLGEGYRDDSLFEPIVYCYRHSIELRLKSIRNAIAKFERGSEESRNEIRGHCLSPSWEKVVMHLRENNMVEDQEEINIVSDLISEMDSIDSTGTMLRYPVEVERNQIDIQNLKNTIDELNNYLVALNDPLDAY